jgi:hypothetical protein
MERYEEATELIWFEIINLPGTGFELIFIGIDFFLDLYPIGILFFIMKFDIELISLSEII